MLFWEVRGMLMECCLGSRVTWPNIPSGEVFACSSLAFRMTPAMILEDLGWCLMSRSCLHIFSFWLPWPIMICSPRSPHARELCAAEVCAIAACQWCGFYRARHRGEVEAWPSKQMRLASPYWWQIDVHAGDQVHNSNDNESMALSAVCDSRLCMRGS